MNILLLGGGGREHALAWKLAQSPLCDRLYAAPGNPGIADHADVVQLDLSDHAAVIGFCQTNAVGLVVVGPEQPLVEGIADSLRAVGIPVFGPGKEAAQLEGSKAFTKAVCDEANIPTAGYARCDSFAEALAALADFGLPVVIKADGLAAGKGVIIAETAEEAHGALEMIFDGAFGAAGARVVIEEFLTGEEASFFALTDGVNVVPFGSAQDHKRVGDGDTGPNTGGMGAYSPATILTPDLEAEVMERMILPTVRTLAARGTPYVGVLYAGLMLTPDGPKLIEYNARFGDPECQVLMMRLEDDLVELLLSVAQGRLASGSARLSDAPAITVVMAANGYPATPDKGAVITLPATGEGVMIFHAGTASQDGDLVSSGGRVLNVTATGRTLAQARADAYLTVDRVAFPGGFCRRDIGWRELARGAH
ncbi:phosphoribosylamine--glycine ligase [Sphingobium sufflavum]|uniref:phosphoribosylamine--glycine ligase n=1 Tax=Sphingobium sufflavum TaxID=1129547 RepID=UPI001F44CA39|nr:phosphoribosylamine--glycine ligase [Sphingobium sufflavum]MCE7795945.1 phosphoribosylamine--glycine ligase [Sphingobium sufflavum]